jgi:hypothetical protein
MQSRIRVTFPCVQYRSLHDRVARVVTNTNRNENRGVPTLYTTEMPSHTVAVPAEGGSPRDSLMFDLMLRGYNRKQVDDYLGAS